MSKRSWSIDPDGNGRRLAARIEIVLTSRVFGMDDGREQWQSEARMILEVVPREPNAGALAFDGLLDAALVPLSERG